MIFVLFQSLFFEAFNSKSYAEMSAKYYTF